MMVISFILSSSSDIFISNHLCQTIQLIGTFLKIAVQSKSTIKIAIPAEPIKHVEGKFDELIGY